MSEVTLLGIHQSNLGYYRDAYPDQESRHHAAEAIVAGEIPDEELMGRNVFNAHWGDTPDQLRAAAAMYYGLGADLDGKDGQSVMVVRRGGLITQGATVPALKLPLIIETGIVAVNKPVVVLGGLDADRAYHAGKSPYVVSRVGIPVIDRRELRVHRGKVNVSQPPSEAAVGQPYEQLTIYGSRVTLDDDQAAYQATRQTKKQEYVVGNRATHNVLAAIMGVASNNHLIRYNKARRAGEIDPKKPLPDLLRLFSTASFDLGQIDELLALAE
jgi:hypothetical protein